jgi:hypothetical protein
MQLCRYLTWKQGGAMLLYIYTHTSVSSRKDFSLRSDF